VKIVNIKVVEGCEVYKFVNRSSSWFGMVCELHGSKVWYIKMVSVFDLAKNAKSQNSPQY
jgi:hypothetical protein